MRPHCEAQSGEPTGVCLAQGGTPTAPLARPQSSVCTPTDPGCSAPGVGEGQVCKPWA